MALLQSTCVSTFGEIVMVVFAAILTSTGYITLYVANPNWKLLVAPFPASESVIAAGPVPTALNSCSVFAGVATVLAPNA